MELSFFKLVDDARFFWDSAKEKRIFRFFPAALLFCLFPAVAYWGIWEHLGGGELFTMHCFGVGFLLGAIGLLGALFLPKKLAYATDQIVFQHQAWQLRKGWQCLFQRKDRGDLDALIKKNFMPKNEKVGYLSSEYPLLKYTHRFKGERVFDVTIGDQEKPHIIFLFLESFRSQDVGVLGGKYGVTPQFDRLANKGVLFSDFYANSVRTSRAVVSSLFGVPSDVDASEVAQRTDTPFIGLPQLLKEAGYAAGYLHNGPIQFENQEAFFKSQDYQTIAGQDDILRMFPEAHANSWGLPDEYLVRYTVDFLEKNRDQPQFLTLFTISNHHPWNMRTGHNPPKLPDQIGRAYGNYLTTFHYTDACLGLLVKELEKRCLNRQVIFFMMGDHGYPMGEHENYIEQRYLYEENIRVPLLIYAKDRIHQPQVIKAPASQLDLVPTVMDLLGLHGFNLSVGSSLMRTIDSRLVFFHNPYVFRNFGCREGRYKFIYTHLSHEIELYDLQKDPAEKHNLAAREPSLVGKYLSAVKGYYRAFFRLYGEKRLAPTETLSLEKAHAEETLADLS
ncbi:MAG: sulfatase-like hydrolase/transferase [Chlamydiota bacterium]